jgi:peroxiredoxin Q/BCP
VHRFVAISAVFALALAAACPAAAEEKEKELKEQDMAPAFELPGSDGETYKLKDFRDKQVVVLAWFPKAFTGG